MWNLKKQNPSKYNDGWQGLRVWEMRTCSKGTYPSYKMNTFWGFNVLILLLLLLLLLSRFSRVRLCAIPLMAAHVPGILQARTLKWVAISFSNAWKWKVKMKSLSRVWLLATPWTTAHQAPSSMGFSRQEYWSGVPSPSPSKVTNLW